jgi:O-antigen/teichoic acid export membrane protein
MNRFESLFKNTLVFSLSTFGSRAVSLALIPMYSYCLSLSEFGELDVTLTLIMLFMPLITGSLYEGVQKYTINRVSSCESIFSSAFLPFIIVASVLGLLIFLIYFLFLENQKILLFYWILVGYGVYEFFSRYAKGIGKELKYAISNIFVALILLLCNFIFIYKLGFNVEGVMLSHALAYTSGAFCLFFWLNIRKVINISDFDVHLLKRMLRLSAPLMLNAAMWWIFDVSDRWLILYFKDAETVGIYSVACKLAALLLLIHSVLFQSWQISAIAHVNDADKSNFYASVSTIYMMIIFSCGSLLIASSQYILGSVLSDEYSQAWMVGNYLLVSMAFFSLASFFGVFYVAYEKTTRALYSSIMAAVINIIANLMLIPYLGVLGAAISTILSTFFLLIFRVFDTKKFCDFNFDIKLLFFCVILISLQMIFISYGYNSAPFIITLFFCITLCLILNKEHNSLVGTKCQKKLV